MSDSKPTFDVREQLLANSRLFYGGDVEVLVCRARDYGFYAMLTNKTNATSYYVEGPRGRAAPVGAMNGLLELTAEFLYDEVERGCWRPTTL
ncbi:hypothetical protein H2199_005233 [Coniosporium tulheliwenetii]|uniref:Uncharacterized protein n=1 Tax=Coniosporium tulheliwenetii TaxID=3383036 RepID=A0ACC2Z324_9PEZI|nr:hypothetical protein H2199_005233 [Cladosporium sp. JES 115]